MKNNDFLVALTIVEQDHQLVLDKVQSLKDTVTHLAGPKKDLRRGLRRLREMHDYFSTHLESHMAEEETALFPLLEECRPDGSALVAKLRQDHEEIRRRREEFGKSLEVARQLEESLPSAVLRDLLAYAWELWEMLDNHAHEETRAVHQCLSRALAGEPA
jgi:iron-sulfur cluster repair protein YtfE (RIC family)